jgi:hypothetical protein
MNIKFIRFTVSPDLSLKMIKFSFDSYMGINNVTLSFALTKKSRLYELNTLKMYFLLKTLTATYPKLKLVSRNFSIISGVTHLTNLSNIYPFFQKLEKFFSAQDRIGFSAFFINKNQINFIIKDYPMIVNFLGLDYDFFNWSIPVRVSLDYEAQLSNTKYKYFFFNSLLNC